ncbi:hypothetical protein T12_7304 [Trichinella patagoniensis]|uniref:Uncharacterized protein n=1 Tax=Trichinella patagoniensis TaxID=990121 RepID=A0A0V0ZL24_9BILA|nr:hypothetical protein T12_7304 [Trichinella patagoniensis]
MTCEPCANCNIHLLRHALRNNLVLLLRTVPKEQARAYYCFVLKSFLLDAMEFTFNLRQSVKYAYTHLHV